MRNLGLAKKALLLALCAALAVPAAGMGWTPLTAEAAQPPVKSNNAANTVQTLTEDEKNNQSGTGNEGTAEDGTPVSDAQKITLKKVLISHYNIKKAQIEAAGNGEAALQYLQNMVGDITKPNELGGTLTGEMYASNLSTFETDVKNQLDSYTTKTETPETPETPQEDPQPSTTNSNIMIGGNWVTPVANAGQYVNVVLPVVNMGRSWVDHVVVTPQISQDAAA